MRDKPSLKLLINAPKESNARISRTLIQTLTSLKYINIPVFVHVTFLRNEIVFIPTIEIMNIKLFRLYINI